MVKPRRLRQYAPRKQAVSRSSIGKKHKGGSDENHGQVRFASGLFDIPWRNLRGGFVDRPDRFNIPAFFELHA
jgi:hypothetical protein